MVKRKCIFCGYVGFELSLTSNYLCPKCNEEFPLGRQINIIDCFLKQEGVKI